MKRIISKIHPLVGFLLALCLAGAFAFIAPLERTLGAGMRLVLFHGSWVWVGIIIFLLSGVFGLIGIVSRKASIQNYSIAFSRTGLFFWLTYLPMSLLVMQIFWNGFYFDEPRWRIPFMLGVVGLLVQVGIWLLNRPMLAAGANAVFAVILVVSMAGLQSVLHPDSPVTTSDSIMIKVNFALVFLTSFICALWMIRFWTVQLLHKTNSGE